MGEVPFTLAIFCAVQRPRRPLQPLRHHLFCGHLAKRGERTLLFGAVFAFYILPRFSSMDVPAEVVRQTVPKRS